MLAIRFQPSVESSYQNWAISDCSGVRRGCRFADRLHKRQVEGVLHAGEALRPFERVLVRSMTNGVTFPQLGCAAKLNGGVN